MEAIKLPLQSKVIWAGIVAFVASALSLAGITDFFVSSEEQQQLVDHIVNGITLVSGVVAIYGRVTAKDKVVMSTKAKAYVK